MVSELQVKTLDVETLPLEEKTEGVEVRLSLDQELDLSRHVLSAYRDLKTSRVPLESEWADNLHRYEGTFQKRQGPWQNSSDIRPPLSRAVVDAMHALYMNSFFGRAPQIVRVQPIGVDDVAKSRKNEDYLNWQLTEEIDFYSVLDKAALDFLGPTGNSFLEPRYVIEKEDREERVTERIFDPLTGKTQMRSKTENRSNVLFDGIKIDVIPSECIYAAPHWEEGAAQAAWEDVLIKKVPATLESIRRKAKGLQPKYHNVDVLESWIARESRENLMAQARREVDRIQADFVTGRKLVEIGEAYLRWPYKGKDEPMIVTLDLNSGVILRVIKGRCRIVHLGPYLVRGRFWRRPLLSILKPIQKNMDAIVNQRIDAGTLANLLFGFYRASGTFDPQVHKIEPGKFYPVDNPGDVVFANPPRVDPSFYREEALSLIHI